MIHDLHLAIRFKTAVTGWFETETHLPQQVAVLVDAYTHSDYALLGQEVGLVIQAVNLCGLLAGPGFDCGRRVASKMDVSSKVMRVVFTRFDSSTKRPAAGPDQAAYYTGKIARYPSCVSTGRIVGLAVTRVAACQPEA